MKKFVDSNIFLRFLLADHPQQSPASKKLFERAARKELKLFTIPIVIIEIGWVLLSHYKRPKGEVAEKLKAILLSEGLEVDGRDLLLFAVEILEKQNIDLIDAYIAAFLKAEKIRELYSYDRDYDKIEGLKRIEP